MSRRNAGSDPIHQFVAFDELNRCALCARQFLRPFSDQFHHIYEIVPRRGYFVLRGNDGRESLSVFLERFACPAQFGSTPLDPNIKLLRQFLRRYRSPLAHDDIGSGGPSPSLACAWCFCAFSLIGSARLEGRSEGEKQHFTTHSMSLTSKLSRNCW